MTITPRCYDPAVATTRSLRIACDARRAYAAAVGVLTPHTEEGAFHVVEDAPPRSYGIAWRGPLSSARYRFILSDEGTGGGETLVTATLWLGGLLGPLHRLLRRRGNRDHLDELLRAVKERVESEPRPRRRRRGRRGGAGRAAER